MRLAIEYSTFREDDMAKLYANGMRNADQLASELGCSVSTVYRTFASLAFYNALMNYGITCPVRLGRS